MLTRALAERASADAAARANHTAARAADTARDPTAPHGAARNLRAVAAFRRRLAYDYARIARDLTNPPAPALEEAS